jgi:hypothetical protein
MRWFARRPLMAIIIEQEYLGLAAHPSYNAGTGSYTCYPFSSHEIHELIIFNPTAIATVLRTFISAHNLSSARTIIALNQQALKEYTSEESANEQLQAPKSCGWSSYRITEKSSYYAYLPFSLRAQYHLLSLSARLNLACITTATAAYCAMLNYDKKELSSSAYTSLSSFKEALSSLYPSNNLEPPYTRGLFLMVKQ